MRIDRFKDGYSFLSNFYIHPVTYKGILYKTSEHAYQTAKTLDLKEQEYVQSASTPGQAKRRGKKGSITLRPDWEQIKVKVMYEIVWEKFQDLSLKRSLLETGTEELMEGNSHGDVCWGCVWKDGKWQGTNYLGRILMRVRDELRSGNRTTPEA